MMVEFRDDDFVAGLDLLPERRETWKPSDVALAPKAISSWRTAEKIRESQASIKQQLIRFRARRVVPVRISVVLIEVVGHCLNDGPRYLCAAGAIEIGHWKAVVLSLQRGKLRRESVRQRAHRNVIWMFVLVQTQSRAWSNSSRKKSEN